MPMLNEVITINAELISKDFDINICCQCPHNPNTIFGLKDCFKKSYCPL